MLQRRLRISSVQVLVAANGLVPLLLKRPQRLHHVTGICQGLQDLMVEQMQDSSGIICEQTLSKLQVQIYQYPGSRKQKQRKIEITEALQQRADSCETLVSWTSNHVFCSQLLRAWPHQ